MNNNVDNNAFLNDNFFEQCPPELLFYHVFPYLAPNDLLTLRLVSKKLQVLINHSVTHSKKKALCPRISTPKQLNALIKNPTQGTGLPYYVIVASRIMLNMLANSLLSNKNKAQEENALLAKIAHIEVTYHLRMTITSDDMLSVNKIVQLGQVHSLNLWGCKNVTDVSSLGQVHSLDLSGCRNITDVSSLGQVHSLDLSYCRNVIDISSLGQVHSLNLSGTNVTDVSSLGQVHSLNLWGCKNVTDVSSLGQVHSLDLTGCKNITDVSSLGQVHSLDLSYCRSVIDISSLGQVHSLNLSGTNVTDVSSLGQVHSLSLKECFKVTDVSSLGQVHSLNLYSCSNVTDVSSLGQVHSLDLSWTNVTDVSSLRQVHSLVLKEASVIDALSKFAPDQKNNDKNLAALSQISHLELGNKKVEQMIDQMQWQTKKHRQKQRCVGQEQAKEYARAAVEENQATDTALQH